MVSYIVMLGNVISLERKDTADKTAVLRIGSLPLSASPLRAPIPWWGASVVGVVLERGSVHCCCLAVPVYLYKNGFIVTFLLGP